jgi:hypothetical protein
MKPQSAQQTQLADSEVTLRAQWEERVRRYRAGDTTAMPLEVVGLGEAHRRQGQGRMVYATAPATRSTIPEPQVVTTIDPTQHADVLIVAPIAGGAR